MLTHSSFIHRLDELAVHARQAVREEQRTNAALRSMPFCAFNGGRDVFVDVGSKDLGIASLQRIVGATPQSTLHMGDQFTQTGNDLLARRACGFGEPHPSCSGMRTPPDHRMRRSSSSPG